VRVGPRGLAALALGAASCAAPEPPAVPPIPAIVATAAAAPPPPASPFLVAPLRYDAAAPSAPSAPSAQAASDDAARATPPPIPDAPAPVLGALQTFRLPNGLRLLVLERHASPLVAAALSVDLTAIGADDVGERRAELLASTFLVPIENVAPASGKCSIDACTIGARGTAAHLEDVLHHVADRAMRKSSTQAEYERRWSAATGYYEQAGVPILRNGLAMLFGKDHPYGGPRSAASPTLADIDGFRRRAFVASASTLVVVGDVTVDAVRAVVAREFGGWAAGEARRAHPKAPRHPSESRIAMCANGGSRQVAVGLVAAGPSPREPDAAAFEVLAQLLGGGLDSELFHGVREELGLAYTVGADVRWFAGASMITVLSVFDGADVFDGTRAMLADITSLEEREPTPDRIARARGSALANWRAAVETDDGIANRLAWGVVAGESPDEVLDWPARLGAVTAADLRVAAQRYLAQAALRIVFLGRPDFIGKAYSLGMGTPVTTDFEGRPVAKP
jgi:zinc protease